MTAASELTLDALVIGGGPAGSACAIRLARGGAKVGLVEATDFSRFRIGETIAPSARPLLSQLDIDDGDDRMWSAPSSGVAAAWGQTTALHRSSLFNPYGRGWRVDRRRFDCMLCDRARDAGAKVFMQCRLVSAIHGSSHWSFALQANRRAVRGRATWIVAATGRTATAPLSPSRSQLSLDRLLAIAILSDAADGKPLEYPTAALVEAAPCGWWYSVAVPDGRALAVFLTDSDLLPAGKGNIGKFLCEQLAHSPLTRARQQFAGDRIRRHCWNGFDARSTIRRAVLAKHWVAIGDAAMAFDPLCGRGVIDALTSGIEIADWLLQSRIVNNDGLPAWATSAADRFNDYCRQRTAIYGEETRWSGSIFWQRRRENRICITPHSPGGVL